MGVCWWDIIEAFKKLAMYNYVLFSCIVSILFYCFWCGICLSYHMDAEYELLNELIFSFWIFCPGLIVMLEWRRTWWWMQCCLHKKWVDWKTKFPLTFQPPVAVWCLFSGPVRCDDAAGQLSDPRCVVPCVRWHGTCCEDTGWVRREQTSVNHNSEMGR